VEVKVEQWPALHAPSHLTPQVPQLFGSVRGSTHCPLHDVVPASHVAPPELLPELPPESLPPELLPEPLLDPEPLDDEDVASLPPASLFGVLELEPLEQLSARQMMTSGAASARVVRCACPREVVMPMQCPAPGRSITVSFSRGESLGTNS
jgi:hypothetical protein